MTFFFFHYLNYKGKASLMNPPKTRRATRCHNNKSQIDGFHPHFDRSRMFYEDKVRSGIPRRASAEVHCQFLLYSWWKALNSEYVQQQQVREDDGRKCNFPRDYPHRMSSYNRWSFSHVSSWSRELTREAKLFTFSASFDVKWWK